VQIYSMINDCDILIVLDDKSYLEVTHREATAHAYLHIYLPTNSFFQNVSYGILNKIRCTILSSTINNCAILIILDDKSERKNKRSTMIPL